MRLDKTIEGELIGNKLPINNFIWGRNIDNGWYCQIRLRWLTKFKTAIDPYFFESHNKRCYLAISLMVRKPIWSDKYHMFKAFVWVPIDDWKPVQLKYVEWRCTWQTTQPN